MSEQSNSSSVSTKLQIARWATIRDDGQIVVEGGIQKFQMKNSDGTGTPLVLHWKFGADIIRFDAGKGVGNHVHDGDHILIVIKGTGIVEFAGVEHDLSPGLVYLVPGSVAHAIRAKSELVMMAVGNDHYPVDSIERMTPV